MTRIKGPMRWAGIFVGLSALLYLAALILSGFTGDSVQFAVACVIYSGFAYGLLQGWRALAYIAFIGLFLGMSVAMQGIWSAGVVPGWVFAGIVLANLVAVVLLFVRLWAPADTVDP